MYLNMKYSSNTLKKQDPGIAAQALEFVLKDVLKIEKVYTAIFIGMFVTFLYQWITYPTNEYAVSQCLLSLETIKVCMWVSALMAIVSHLMPNGGLKKQPSRGDNLRNFYELNKKLHGSLLTAINIDQQKRLDQVKRKPTFQPRAVPRSQISEKEKEPLRWQPTIAF